MSRYDGALDQDRALPSLFVQGPDAVLVRFSNDLNDAANRAALRFRAEVSAAPPEGLVELASALVSVLVRFDPKHTNHRQIAAALRPLLKAQDWDNSPLPSDRRHWHVPVAFGGPHGPALSVIAQRIGLSEDQVVRDVTSTPLRVLALGFAPGQPYLGFLPQAYDIPRQTDLTPRVPASSLVMAVRQIVLFANAAPTGWWQIGQSHLPCCRPEHENPVLLAPGDEIRFHAVGHAEFDTLSTAELGGIRCEALP